MYIASIISMLGLLVSLTTAYPSVQGHRSNEVSVYWGFGKERRLASYCSPGQGINTLIIGSITNLKSGGTLTGIFGEGCTVNTDGSFTSGCARVAKDIPICQAFGVKIFVGFSSDGNVWGINGSADASHIASELWKTFGGDTSSGAKRPFGGVKVDGFDFDVEGNPHNQSQAYLGELVNDLRGHFSEDSSRTYYISGAPQCGIPDPNMGKAMMQAKFDYIWIQFYNNDCSAADLVRPIKNNPDGTGKYNLDKWPAYLANGASKDAALYVGLPASKDAAVPYDWIKPDDLLDVIAVSPAMRGIMLWNTAHSDATINHDCYYAQNIATIFQTGRPC